MSSEVVVGIDLGTTNSSISFWNANKKIENIKDGLKNLIPSKILIDQDKNYFGNYIPILNLSNDKQSCLIHSFKRLINTSEKNDFIKSLPYQIERNNDSWIIKTSKKSYPLEEILVLFISHLKNNNKIS